MNAVTHRPPFRAQLAALWEKDPGRLLCVGLDPDPQRLPQSLRSLPISEAVERFLIGVVEATLPYAAAFKPQFAHFAAHGWEAVLTRVVAAIRHHAPEIPVILDAKRGDIGSTAAFYAQEAFARYQADALTVNPYLGTDSLSPYWTRYPDRGLFVLCRTSNPGGDDLQFACLASGERLYEHVARWTVERWNPHGQTGLVVGATYPEEIARVRAIASSAPLLVPGIGAQGGDIAATVAAGFASRAFPALLLNSSRAILYADSGDDWQRAAGIAAEHTARAIAAALPNV